MKCINRPPSLTTWIRHCQTQAYLSIYVSTYIAPLQGNYSEALPAQARPKRKAKRVRNVLRRSNIGLSRIAPSQWLAPSSGMGYIMYLWHGACSQGSIGLFLCSPKTVLYSWAGIGSAPEGVLCTGLCCECFSCRFDSR